MDDPFGTDDNYVYEGSDTDRDGEELLEDSAGGDTGGEEEEHEEQDGAGVDGEAGVKDGGEPSQDVGTENRNEVGAAHLTAAREVSAAAAAAADLNIMSGDEHLVEVEPEPALPVRHPDNMYQAVRSIMSGGQDPVKLNPRMKYNRGEDPGFMTPGDERILRNANMCNMEF